MREKSNSTNSLSMAAAAAKRMTRICQASVHTNTELKRGTSGWRANARARFLSRVRLESTPTSKGWLCHRSQPHMCLRSGSYDAIPMPTDRLTSAYLVRRFTQRNPHTKSRRLFSFLTNAELEPLYNNDEGLTPFLSHMQC